MPVEVNRGSPGVEKFPILLHTIESLRSILLASFNPDLASLKMRQSTDEARNPRGIVLILVRSAADILQEGNRGKTMLRSSLSHDAAGELRGPWKLEGSLPDASERPLGVEASRPKLLLALEAKAFLPGLGQQIEELTKHK